ncbi:hypothetical protein Tco_1136476 [Tanacetum coccineum]
MKEKYNLDTATNLARAKLNKCSGDADLSKKKSGPESSLEFRRSWTTVLGRTRGQTGIGGDSTRGRSGDQGNGGIDGQGGQVGGQVTEVNDGVDGVPDFSTIIAQQLHNLLPTILAQVGNQGRNQGNDRNQNGDAINDNIWDDVRNIEKMESVQDMSGCRDSQKVKYTAGSFVGKALMWWNSQIHTRSREATVGISLEDFKTLTSKEFCPVKEMQKLETEF